MQKENLKRKKTKVVNFVGGPGSGKTVMCSLVFAELKMRGFCVEYVTEFAKQLVWAESFELLNNQHFVTKHQFELLEAVNGKVDFIVTDGSLLHGYYYNKWNKDNLCNVDKVSNLILDSLKHFDNIFIHLSKGNYPYEIAGRQQNEQEAKVIGIQMENILNELELPYEKFASKKESVMQIIQYINNVSEKTIDNHVA